MPTLITPPPDPCRRNDAPGAAEGRQEGERRNPVSDTAPTPSRAPRPGNPPLLAFSPGEKMIAAAIAALGEDLIGDRVRAHTLVAILAPRIDALAAERDGLAARHTLSPSN